MAVMKKEYIERIYAGWMAKIIGIRLGAPVEGWTYEQIKEIYGAPDGSTEHTAYLNLRNGIKAPLSGSIELNGAATAEQIGGQIFIDTWGLVAPGNPDLAARLAAKAASVTHGGNGIYGGIFIAVCISCAFVETDIRKIIEKGLSYIPADCEYAVVVRKVMDFYDLYPDCWENCYRFIRDNHGYDKYPGACHIIPNIAVMILALLYGGGDFSDTLNICNRCGWDTDCNVGNIATIMGVRGGLSCIDYEKWRKPINDFLIYSSVMGSMNIADVPSGASYMVKLAARLAGEELPPPYDAVIPERLDSCHFEYPGSTHAIRVRMEHLDDRAARNTNACSIENTTESADHTWKRIHSAIRPEGGYVPLRKGGTEREYLSRAIYVPGKGNVDNNGISNTGPYGRAD